MLLQVGDTEILLKDDAVRFVERAQAAGVDATLEVYPDMPHVFQAFAPYLPDANQALQRIGEFIKRQSIGNIEQISSCRSLIGSMFYSSL